MENSDSNNSLVDSEAMEVAELLKQFQSNSQKKTKGLTNRLKSTKSFNINQGTNLYDRNYGSHNLQSPAPNLNPLFSSSIQNLQDQETMITLKTEYEDYIDINQHFHLPLREQYRMKRYIRILKKLFNYLSFPSELVVDHITIRIKNRKVVLRRSQVIKILLIVTIRLIVLYFIYQFIIWLCRIVSWLLRSAFKRLSTIALIKNSKSKEDENKLDQIEESKGFWDKNLGSLSQVLKIGRGGRFIPIREVNIYEFSELDQQHALLSVSSMQFYLQFNAYKAELKKFGFESRRTPSVRKRLRLKVKEFSSKLKEFPSKLKKFIPLRNRSRIYKKLLLTIGFSIFLMGANSGTMILSRPRNFTTCEIVVPTQPSVPFVVPSLEPSVDEAHRNISSILSEMKNPSTNSSRLKSVSRVRKKAKLVRLSDLPALTEQDLDREIDLPNIPTSIGIKIR